MTTEESIGTEGAIESAETEETLTEETATATSEETTEAEAEPDRFEGVEDAEPKPDEGDAESDEDTGEEAAEEEEAPNVEFNFGGNKLEVPKGALPAELEAKVQEFSDNIWSDYTKGKQANADEAKQVATEREAVAKLTTLNGEALQTYSRGLQVRQEIEQLSQVDTNALWQSNPDQARQVSDRLASKQAELQNIISQVGQQEAALDEAQQADLVRRTDEGKALLDRRFKDFSTEKAPEVVKYAVEKGMEQAEAEKWALNPRVTEMAYKAMMYDRMQATPKKAKAAPKPAKPVTAPKAPGRASKPKSEIPTNMDDFVKWRNAGNG